MWAWYPGIKWKVRFRQKNAEDALSKKGSDHPGLATSQSVSLRWIAEDRALLCAGAGMRLESS